MKTTLAIVLVAGLGIAAQAASLGTSSSSASSSSGSSSGMGGMGDNSSVPGMAGSMLDYFNAFQHIMPCGDPSMDIPVLEPFRKSIVSLNVDHPLLKLNGSIENLVIKGLSDFTIIELVYNKSDHRTTWDIIWDNIQILGDYKLYLNEDLAGYEFVVNLNGLMDIHVKDLRIISGRTVGKNAVGGLQLSDMDYYVQLGNIESYILDTQWSVAFNNFFNEYVRQTTLLWVELNREYISDVLSAYVTEYRNTRYYNITMMERMEWMVATSEKWNAIPCQASS